MIKAIRQGFTIGSREIRRKDGEGLRMKLKTRLIFSFCVMLFLPIVLAGTALLAVYQMQVHTIKQTYGLEKDEGNYLFSNSLQILNRYTKTDFEELEKIAWSDPQKLTDKSYLEQKNTELQEKQSFLVSVSDDQIYYNGEKNSVHTDAQLLELLPDYGSQCGDNGYYLENDVQWLVKQVDFRTADGHQNSVYIVASTENVLPEMKKLIMDMGVSVVLVLILTAAVMTIWIYKGIINPIAKLKVATQNIKEGNLDFTIEAENEDEIGELCRNFEQMRQRLKESTEEKISSEKENRILISNIAHDLKTPLTTIKGYAEGIMDGIANTPEKQEKYIRTIYNKATEMDRLINELTLYSKIDTNRIPYNFKKINVEEYFSDCVEDIGLELEAADIGLAYYNYADEKTVIIADPEQLKRVLSNIVGNSVKYMNKQKGFINIRIKDVGDFIQVEIEDNGQGIPVKDLPYIFDRFYRSDASRNSGTGGSGIGLSIVKKIIEDHGGKIWATSKENTGTVMYFVIRKYQEVPNE